MRNIYVSLIAMAGLLQAHAQTTDTLQYKNEVQDVVINGNIADSVDFPVYDIVNG